MDREKTKQLILHITNACQEDEKFGFLRLNYLLWFIDSTQYRSTGKTLTGGQYFKTEDGFQLDGIEELLEELEDAGLLEKINIDEVTQEE